jgi:hypothetical protein
MDLEGQGGPCPPDICLIHKKLAKILLEVLLGAVDLKNKNLTHMMIDIVFKFNVLCYFFSKFNMFFLYFVYKFSILIVILSFGLSHQAFLDPSLNAPL